jgi:hypothetical protein
VNACIEMNINFNCLDMWTILIGGNHKTHEFTPFVQSHLVVVNPTVIFSHYYFKNYAKIGQDIFSRLFLLIDKKFDR